MGRAGKDGKAEREPRQSCGADHVGGPLSPVTAADAARQARARWSRISPRSATGRRLSPPPPLLRRRCAACLMKRIRAPRDAAPLTAHSRQSPRPGAPRPAGRSRSRPVRHTRQCTVTADSEDVEGMGRVPPTVSPPLLCEAARPATAHSVAAVTLGSMLPSTAADCRRQSELCPRPAQSSPLPPSLLLLSAF